jgi:hypothetical protein
MTRLAPAIAAVVALACASGCHHHREANEPAPGASWGPETPPPDETRTIVTRDLGAVAADACDVAGWVTSFGPKCKRVAGEQATGSEPTTSANAFDANACTNYEAGGEAPRFVAVDFGKLQTVTGVVLIAEMPAAGAMKHVIESSDDGATWKVAYVIEGQMAGSRAYAVPFQTAVTARYLRVTTEKSTGAVAWRDIVPVDCS